MGLYTISFCVILNPIRIFAPCVKILFFINHYFLVCIFKYRKCSRKFHWYFVFILGYKSRITVFFQTISVVAATSQTGNISKNKSEGALDSSVMIFVMSILTNDSFVYLLRFLNRHCQELFVFLCTPSRSRALLCIPVHFICILIDLCWRLLFNLVQSCAFYVALNWPLSEIRQSCAFSVAQIGLCRKFFLLY